MIPALVLRGIFVASQSLHLKNMNETLTNSILILYSRISPLMI